jgi:hypothetical protein
MNVTKGNVKSFYIYIYATSYTLYLGYVWAMYNRAVKNIFILNGQVLHD